MAINSAQWARLHTAADCGLQLGAWYRVTALTAREAHVLVGGGRVRTVTRALLEFRGSPPLQWTAVLTPLAGSRAGATTDGHLVCPNCRYRAALPGAEVTALRCAHCNQLFSVAWTEPYLGARAQSAAPTASTRRDRLATDRRVMPRRLETNRRNGIERRTIERRQHVLVGRIAVERRCSERRHAMRRSGHDRRSGVERRRRRTLW